MSEVKIDTVKMRETGENILKLVEDLKSTYQDFFTRLENVPTKTREWVGPTSEEFFGTIKFDKIDFMAFTNNLYKYGKYLVDSANEFEFTIQKIRR